MQGGGPSSRGRREPEVHDGAVLEWDSDPAEPRGVEAARVAAITHERRAEAVLPPAAGNGGGRWRLRGHFARQIAGGGGGRSRGRTSACGREWTGSMLQPPAAVRGYPHSSSIFVSQVIEILARV